VNDRIALRRIQAHGKHGADPGERDAPQLLEIDLELELDLSKARASDALKDTIDYAALHATIVALVRERSFSLLERLGDEILHTVMRDARVRAATVTIAKPKKLDGATPQVTVRSARN
jgi:dihydroneopterin aldolase